jgi:hypothetical protein
MDGAIPYVAFSYGVNSGKATVMGLTAGGWQTVGMAGFSAGQAQYLSRAIDRYSGTFYIAYEDGGNGNKVTVMRFK